MTIGDRSAYTYAYNSKKLYRGIRRSVTKCHPAFSPLEREGSS